MTGRMDIYLDFRGGALRILLAGQPGVSYAQTFSPFSGDAAGLKEIIGRVSRESGASFDRAHIIVPSEEVITTRYKLQAMPLPDIEKVIRRKVIAELKIAEPVFHFMPVDADKRQRTYFVELVSPEVARKYSKLLSSAGLKVRTVTSAFRADLRFFGSSRGEPAGTGGIFDIDNETIEVTVLSHAEVIYNERIPLTYPGEEKADAPASDRAQKMKLYRIMDAIYKVQLSYQELYPDNPIKKIWLCGLRGGAEGVADSLREAVDAEIISGDESAPQGYAYSSLLGLAAGVADGSAANFITRKSLRQLPARTIRLAMGIAACFVIAVMAIGFSVYENKYRDARMLLEESRKIRKARQEAGREASPYLLFRDQIGMLRRTQFSYYDLLRLIANRLPEGSVMDSFGFKGDQSTGTVDLVFLTPYHPSAGREKILTNLTEITRELGACSRNEEPLISTIEKDKEKFLKAEYRCEAYHIEKKK